MTIYAMRVANDEEVVAMVFRSLSGGEGRFGWSWAETADLHVLRDRIRRHGGELLSEGERECYQGQKFLISLKRGDYVVYINVPEWGLCTVADVTGGYYWRYEGGDFNHRFPVAAASVVSFDRNAGFVPESLSRRLKLRGRWWRICVPAEFEAMLATVRGER